MKRASFLVLLITSLVYHSCVTKDTEYYEKRFRANESVYNSLNDYLLNKYSRDPKFVGKARLIFINSKAEKRTLKIEIVDDSIQDMLSKANLSSVYMEHEDANCSVGLNYDKIYYYFNKRDYKPIVSYIYSSCVQDSINCKTSKISRKTIKAHWDILIDNS